MTEITMNFILKHLWEANRDDISGLKKCNNHGYQQHNNLPEMVTFKYTFYTVYIHDSI